MEGGFKFEELTSFTPKLITQLYGGPASGKSNLCMIAAAEVARSGKNVIFIDTEGSFSPQRFKQIAGDEAKDLLKLIIVAEPSDFDEQKIAINKVIDMMGEKDVGLIVVDSLVSLYRLEMGDGDWQATSKELSRQLSKLMKIARKHDVPIVVTNQVYNTFAKDGEACVVMPVGRDILRYWSKVTIHLWKEGEFRVAELMRHTHKPEGAQHKFTITQEGIKDESIADNSSPELQG